jgi:hypothetical protein
MSNAHRWSKFWWQDWQSDKALSRCSLAARGLWMELLCIAHEGEPYGHLRLNGHGLDAAEIADMVTKTTTKEVAKLLAELEDKGVFSRTHDGTIYSRRMQRDGKQSEVGREAATRRWGGNGASHPNGWPIGLPNGSGIGEAIREPISQPNALEADTETETESKKVSEVSNLTYLSSPVLARARELAPPVAAETPKPGPDGYVVPAEERADPGAVAAATKAAVQALHHIAYAPGWSAKRSVEKQIEVLEPPHVKPAFLNRELLDAMPHRQRAFAAVGRR